jgi:fatty acid desaturase
VITSPDTLLEERPASPGTLLKERPTASRSLLKERPTPPPQVKSLIRPLSRRDDWLNWMFLAGDWSVIAVAVTVHLLVPGPVVYFLAVIVIGSRMRALGNLLHEAAHLKLFRNRGLNDVVGRLLCASPIFAGYGRYVAAHKLHHRNLWRNAQDPDLPLYTMTRTETSSRDRESFAAFVGKHVLLVIIPVMPMRRLCRDTLRDRISLVSISTVAATGIVLPFFAPPLISQVVVFCWIIPWFTAFQYITYWAELGEHGGLRKHGWSWGSRNWRGNLVTRWLIGSHSDDLYHLLHHWFPTVPHHRLRYLDSTCRSEWAAYRVRSRCAGFFLGSETGVSVLRDIWSGGEPVGRG